MAAPTPTPRRGPSAGGVIPAEWPAQAADTIVETIAKVRDKTTTPVLKGARGIVYGLVIAVVGLIAFNLLLIAIIRAYSNYFPGDVWILYAIFFALFTGGGLILLRLANKPSPKRDV